MNFNLENITRENVKGLKPYSSARDEFEGIMSSAIVFLDANENPYENGVNRYPDPQQQSLKEHLGGIKNVKPENILLGNGSDEVLDLLFRAFCEPKEDNIITLPPTYGMYKVLSEVNTIENREVLLTSDFELNTSAIFDASDDRTKIIFICSPNNPTGNSFSEERIIQLLSRFSGLVVIDEAYIDFSERSSWISRLSDFPNLIITQTLSKAYGMAGIRLGICVASKEIISILNKIKPPYNVNDLTQSKAIERIMGIENVRDEIRAILDERNKLNKALPKINFIKTVYPTDANFILVKVDDADKRYSMLAKRGIIVRNRSKQSLCENTLRFTVGTPEENTRLINTLRDIEEWEKKYSL